MALFQIDIASWADWGRVFQDREAFTPLCMAILEKEGLPQLPLSPLTPGTNAVFRSGGAVLKVFYPPECGADSLYDWETEKRVLEFAAEAGVSAPKLLAAGEIEDQYLFRYLIIEFCKGREAGGMLAELPPEEKTAFAAAVRAMLARMNQPAEGLIAQKDLARQALTNPRFEGLHPGLRADFRALANEYGALDKKVPPFFSPVLVHGDCTGENLLAEKVGNEFSLRLIDFADCCIAPCWYELPPVTFELFREDPLLVQAYIGEASPAEFLERLIWGLALHDFGGDILKGFFARRGIDPGSVDSVTALYRLLAKHFFAKDDLPIPFLFPEKQFPALTESLILSAFPNTRFLPPSGDPAADAEKLYLENGKGKTLAHVQAVAETAAQLAEQFGLDAKRCRTAAMLHDLAAILPKEEMLAKAKEWGMPLDEAERRYPMLLHQRFSALLARHLLHLTDEEALSAIQVHTTLKADPSPYDLAVFLADKISWDQQGQPPYLALIEQGLAVSLQQAAFNYLDDAIRCKRLLLPHCWLLAAYRSLP